MTHKENNVEASLRDLEEIIEDFEKTIINCKEAKIDLTPTLEILSKYYAKENMENDLDQVLTMQALLSTLQREIEKVESFINTSRVLLIGLEETEYQDSKGILSKSHALLWSGVESISPIVRRAASISREIASFCLAAVKRYMDDNIDKLRAPD